MTRQQFEKYFSEKSNHEILNLFLKHKRERFYDDTGYSVLLHHVLTRDFSPEEKEIINKAMTGDMESIPPPITESFIRQLRNPVESAALALKGAADLIKFYFIINLALGGIIFICVFVIASSRSPMQAAGLSVVMGFVGIIWSVIQFILIFLGYKRMKEAGDSLLEFSKSTGKPDVPKNA